MAMENHHIVSAAMTKK